MSARSNAYGERPTWTPEAPKLRPARLVLSWLVSAVALLVAAALVPHVDIPTFWGAVVVAAIVAIVNAVLPPILAALRLPLTLVIGFLGVLFIDAVALLLASDWSEHAIQVDSFWWALLTALVAAAASVVLQVATGTNDDDTYAIRVTRRIARRQGGAERTDVPGIVYLEIDGLALPVLRRALRDGNAPHMARWLADEHAPAGRVGDGSLVADGRQPGRHPARLERGHPRLPLGGEGDGQADDLLGARRLRRDRAAAVDGDRPARERRRQPRQPALGRGRPSDPHREPHRGGEASRTLATAPSSRTASTSRVRSSCSSGRWSSSGPPPSARSAATSGRVGTAAASTRSCAPRCA